MTEVCCDECGTHVCWATDSTAGDQWIVCDNCHDEEERKQEEGE